ncbi:MAG: anthranilate synthase component I [Spirochaetes bacterium]|nr:anthranilate synthase component I [Spirochaetota bacterium]
MYTEKNEFIQLTNEYNLIPLYTELRADLYTTVSLFLRLKKDRYQYLLESAVSGEFFGRYSFMGTSDRAIVCKNNKVSISSNNGIAECGHYDNPLEFVREYFQKIVPYKNSKLPPFTNGVIGYLGYDTVRYFEDIPLPVKDELNAPDFEFIIADKVIIYDHLIHKLYLVYSCVVNENDNPAEVYDKGVAEIQKMAVEIEGPGKQPEPFKIKTDNGKLAFRSNFSKQRFEEAVEKAREYIYDGDIFQVVLSQKLKVPVSGDAFNLYRSLRVVNPSPYMFYLKCNDIEIIGSSPEVLVQLNEGQVTIRPIAGTKPRGKNPEEDIQLKNELLADEKELAEHVMLVDLGRNDIGRVAQGGTVKVDQFKVIEYYSHVMHIVSNVVGKLSGEYDVFDVIKAAFPAGTLSGAPKIRAMEIISELEPERRGIYGGMVGYLTFDQNLDSCITIRTFVIKDNIAYLQAGAGLVADSNPEREYYETIHKMKALIKAMEFVEN